MSRTDPLLAPMKNADRREVGGVTIEVVSAGASRVKRMIYPPGFRWSTHMKPIVGTDLCKNAHVGFLARGQIQVRYADGCTAEFTAPQAVAIEPGHAGSVIGNLPAVRIEFDFESEAIQRLCIPGAHLHRP